MRQPPVPIIRSADARRVRALLDRRPGHDAALARRVSAIVADVRRRGDRALLAYARRFDGCDGILEVGRDEMRRAAAPSRRACGAPYAWPPRTSGTVRRPSGPPFVEREPGARRAHHAARRAARPRGLLRARRTIPASLVTAHDGHSGHRRRSAGGHRRLPEARPDRHVRGARGGRDTPVPDWRRPRGCGARLRHRQRTACGQDRRARERLRRCRQGAGRRRLRD
jgi:hypothetical protein